MTSSTKDYLYGRKKEAIRNTNKMLAARSEKLEIENRLLETLHKTKIWLEGTIESLESYDSNADSERLLSEYREKLHDVKEQMHEVKRASTTEIQLQELDQFNWKSLPDDLLADYAMLVLSYEQTGSFHYALELFALLVRKGVSPPAWVLRDIADRVANYLNEPERQPKALIKHFGLAGDASGATNPADQQNARRQRSMMMIEMAALVRDFDLSRNRAAQAITIKYELTKSVSTIKRWFKEYFGDGLERVVDAKNPVVMTEVERIQFVSSFPPSARRLFKKSSAR